MWPVLSTAFMAVFLATAEHGVSIYVSGLDAATTKQLQAAAEKAAREVGCIIIPTGDHNKPDVTIVYEFVPRRSDKGEHEYGIDLAIDISDPLGKPHRPIKGNRIVTSSNLHEADRRDLAERSFLTASGMFKKKLQELRCPP